MANGNGRGRPPVVPGEDSVVVQVTIEVTLLRQLRWLAQRDRVTLPDAARTALREYAAREYSVLKLTS